MNDKNWYASKTVWANALAIIATIAGALGMDFGLTPEVQAEIAVAGIAVVNIVLRFVTKAPIK